MMTPEERRSAWIRFMSGALAAGKSTQEASVEADSAVKELEQRDIAVQQQQQVQP